MMNMQESNGKLQKASPQQLARPRPVNVQKTLKSAGFITIIVVLSNLISHSFLNNSFFNNTTNYAETKTKELYLLDKASLYVSNAELFEHKVREVANKLEIPPEWIMSIIYSESRFDASVVNRKGSGAAGLIQWMPATAKDFGITVDKLRNLNHIQQMEYVYLYFKTVSRRYGKKYKSLTDLYLAVLYPKALGQDYCYTLYAKPSRSYQFNAGLDENKDGRVTVSDVDVRMQRIFPTAYMAKHEK